MKTIQASRILPRFRAPTSLTVRRKATGTFTNGRYTPAATETTVTITNASVQPLGGRELLLLPEGFRTRQALKVYSPELLRGADAEAGYEADRFEYLGETFEVYACEDWSEHGGYYRATAVQLHKT